MSLYQINVQAFFTKSFNKVVTLPSTNKPIYLAATTSGTEAVSNGSAE